MQKTTTQKIWSKISTVLILVVLFTVPVFVQGETNEKAIQEIHVPKRSFGAVIFDQPGEHRWSVPPGIRFVLVRACGGGGSGGGFLGSYGGGGGGGSPIITTLVGPLEEPVYKVSIGVGGVSSNQEKKLKSQRTIFEGLESKANRTVWHGGGRGLESIAAISRPGTKRPAIRSNGSEKTRAGPGGGPSYEPGSDSMFATGGQIGDVRASSHENMRGGGGGAGIGDGGRGGADAIAQPGGTCAGGGGGSHNHRKGASGGNGYMLLLPIHDVESVIIRSNKAIEQLLDQP